MLLFASCLWQTIVDSFAGAEKDASLKKKCIPSIFKDESTESCICLWKLAVTVATYVSICIV
jgi:hypothetical protein